MGVLALGGIGACRVVESKADGAAVFCPVVGTKGRAVTWGTGCRTVAIFGAFGAKWLGVCRTPYCPQLLVKRVPAKTGVVTQF